MFCSPLQYRLIARLSFQAFHPFINYKFYVNIVILILMPYLLRLAENAELWLLNIRHATILLNFHIFNTKSLLFCAFFRYNK